MGVSEFLEVALLGSVPEVGGDFLRDFLYVDLGRTRSLLAQLYEGVPEKRELVEEKQRRWQAGVKSLFGLGIDTARQSTHREQEQRALGDLHFVLLEDLAEAAGYLIDISEQAGTAEAWTDGSLHSQLNDGQLVRISGPTQIISPTQFASLIEKMDSFFGGMGATSAASQPSPLGSPGDDLAAQLFASLMPGGPAPSQTSEMSSMAAAIRELLYGPGVFVRTMPLGPDQPELAVSGLLATPSEYLSEAETGAILSRFGAQARPWTIVGQVARVPSREKPRSQKDMERQMQKLSDRVVKPGTDQLDRSVLEKMMIQTWQYLESLGFSESPAWPAITVVPLAVYRTVSPIRRPAAADL